MFAMFDILSFIVPIMFIVVLASSFFYHTGDKQWHKNNNSPRLTYRRWSLQSGQMSRITGCQCRRLSDARFTQRRHDLLCHVSGRNDGIHVSGLEYGMLAEAIPAD